ncbi:MAG: 4a-hydroxytetrahydrobiopterin dehydratase [Patescibacteria group bacterium]|nr:4a-hydroxytetrahydrobiopterin dehydratase [Patescibacteria group bacterium]
MASQNNPACSLTGKHCIPCEGGVPPLTEDRIAELLSELSGWTVRDGKILGKHFEFRNFKEVIQVVNQIADIADAEGHHPDLYIHSWKHLDVKLSTHAIGGLSENDFILAAKIDAVVG